jgi:alpha-2-macroglobulin
MRWSIAAATLVLALGAACGGLPGQDAAESELDAEIAQLEGTELAASTAATFDISNGGAPPTSAGDGVQVLQVAPLGTDVRPAQVAVVFDRPMVALAELDATDGDHPLSCEPAIPGAIARWAGTTTAVLGPNEGRLPRATAFTCKAEAGITAIDGVALEKTVTWSFETPRPSVSALFPPRGAKTVNPTDQVAISFSHDIDLDTVRPFVHLRSGPSELELDLEVDPKNPRRLVGTAPMSRDTAYALVVEKGWVSSEGPLQAAKGITAEFRTYPPLSASFDQEKTQAIDPSFWLRIRTSTPVTRTEMSKTLTFDPPLDGWSAPQGDWSSTSWSAYLGLKPRTTYTITAGKGAEDVYGQTLDNAIRLSLTTGDHPPKLYMEDYQASYAANNPPELPIKHLNLGSIDVAMAAVELPAMLETTNPNTLVDKALKAARGSGGLRSPSVEVDGRPNVIELDTIDFAPLVEAGEHLIAIDVTSPALRDHKGNPRHRRLLLNVTDLGVHMEVSPGEVLAWITRLSDGTPVKGAEVALYMAGDHIGTGTTDEGGVVSVQGAPGDDWNAWSNEELTVVAKTDDDLAFVRHNWNSGMSPWRFGHSGDFDADGEKIRSHGFTDRGIYKPGDPVHARATWRRADASGLSTPDAPVSWSLESPDGDTVDSGEGTLDARGGWSVSTALPKDAKIGNWSVVLTATVGDDKQSVYLSTPVRAYRAPAFRVEVAAKDNRIAGDSIQATADARYLFGTPISSGTVRWNAWKSDAHFQPDGWEGFSFRWHKSAYSWEDDTEGYEDPTVHSGEGELEAGRSTLELVLEQETFDTPSTLFLEANVETPDRQQVASSAQVMVHPAPFYLGARAEKRLPTVSEATYAEVAAITPRGMALQGVEAKVEVSRRTWNRVREKGMDGTWSWVNQPEDSPVHGSTLTTDGNLSKVEWTPKEAGQHRIEVSATADNGALVRTVETVWVVGSQASWANTDDMLSLIPDKDSYGAGDTAEVMVTTPRPNMWAIVSLEREGVLWREVRKLKGTAETVKIPLGESHRPNVFVSVVAVEGAGPQDAPDKGRAQAFMGMTELKVDSDPAHLEVEVSPAETVYRPGDEVEVQVSVGRHGRPAAGAGVTLYAVDEGVLSLTGYETPDGFSSFYGARDVSVLHADSRTKLLDRAPYLTKGAPPGGGGGEEGGPAIRENFVTTVAWLPGLTTGEDGTVTARFTLADNLTAFRVMAVADHASDGFGSADAEITVTRPLIARPALPRFLRVGDVAFAGIVVHNNDESGHTVAVKGSETGDASLSQAPEPVWVDGLDAVEVPFKIEAHEQGEATFTFEVASGPEKDAVRVSIPIRRDVAIDTVATTGTTDSSATEQLVLPDGAIPGYGGLTLGLSRTVLVGAGAGYTYLERYPHRCLEQHTSRTMAHLTAWQVHDSIAVDATKDELEDRVQKGLSELSNYRLHDGGYTMWKGWRQASTPGTAYALELMGRAREAGFDVDDAMVSSAVSHLRGRVNAKTWRGWSGLERLGAEAGIARSLARVEAGDAGLNSRLYSQRNDLGLQGKALLLEAIARSTGPDSRTTSLRNNLEANMVIEAASATIEETGSGRWWRLWASHDLTQATALEALVVAFDELPLAPRMARSLALAQDKGRWRNTRATAAALASLAQYASRYEDYDGEVEAALTLAGKPLVETSLTEPFSSTLPIADLTGGPLVFQASGGRLYYELRLATAPSDPPPRDQGFTIVREIEVLEGGGEDGTVTAGAMLGVTLRIVTPTQRTQVAVVDPLPAGLEPVDSTLATTSGAPGAAPAPGEQPPPSRFGGSWVFDHTATLDHEVRLYASTMPAGVHTWRYVARATSPGSYEHPAATVEEMYEPENFGRTATGRLVVGAPAR